MQESFGSGVGTREGRELDIGELRVDREGLGGPDGRVLGEAAVHLGTEGAAGHPGSGIERILHRSNDDPVAQSARIDAGTDVDDRSGGVGSLDAGEVERRARPAPVVVDVVPVLGVPADAGVDVRVVDSSGADPDQHLVPRRRRHHHVGAVLERLGAAVTSEKHRMHGGHSVAIMSQPLEFFDLSGRTAIVTGGSRGLGREMVLAFAAQGANVVIASRKLENCEALAAEVEALHDVRALPVECHIGYWDQAEALAETAYAEFGEIDILVNNAGMSPLYPSISAIDEALYDKVMEVNLKGTFRLTVLVADRMKARGSGSVMFVSSSAAVKPTEGEVVYGMAKAGLHNLTESFSKAYGPEVRVNCIQPGPFLTDISKAWSEAALDHLGDHIALGRAGEPHEVVGAALYFASDASSYTTGAILRMDGGLR